eukprot:Sdes_comp16085_c0_seq1m5289
MLPNQLIRGCGKLSVNSSRVLLCDMQEKFVPIISHYPAIAKVCDRIMKVAGILQIPRLVTEHYPKGLGRTDSSISTEGSAKFEKTLFSMNIPEVDNLLWSDPKRRDIILCGIEAHVCIQQTAFDLLENGFQVHVVADAVSSRSMVDRKFALQRMRDSGCFITTSESLIFMLLKDAKHPQFKEVIPLVKEVAPDSDLLSV